MPPTARFCYNSPRKHCIQAAAGPQVEAKYKTHNFIFKIYETCLLFLSSIHTGFLSQTS